jgi:heme/copper-type cytochrome/quinol oxidase subunit 3
MQLSPQWPTFAIQERINPSRCHEQILKIDLDAYVTFRLLVTSKLHGAVAMTNYTTADKLVRRRARAAIIFATIFFSSQVASFGRGAPDLHNPGPYQFGYLAAWIGWTAMLLLALATGGGLLRSTAVRSLMNDETTLIHRQRGYISGFWGAVLTALSLYIVDLYQPLVTGDALRFVVTAGVGIGLFTFGVLERRALSHG